MKNYLLLAFLLLSAANSYSQKEAEKIAYTRMVKNADSLYLMGNCKSAIDSFKTASTIIKKDFYSLNRIAEIEYCMQIPDSVENYCACRKNKIAISTRDNKIREAIILIDRCDSALTKGNLELAAKYKQELLRLDLLRYIDAKTNAISSDAGYNIAIKRANEYFDKEDYAAAKAKYNDASKIRPNEQYPKDRINAINKIIAEQEKFRALKIEAETLFAQKNYKLALEKFNKALELQPEDPTIKKRITECKQALGQNK